MMHEIQRKYVNEIDELVQGCHHLAAWGYVASSGGNLSMRVEKNLILITPTKTAKRFMTFDDICIIDMDGNLVFSNKNKKPTGETPFHTRIFQKRQDIKAIVHAHPPILTGFAIAKSSLLAKPFLPEPILEVGPILNVPYETPLTDALSEQFDKVIEKSNGFLMENHGALICNANSITEAVEQMQMIENMALSIFVSIQLGGYKTISEHHLKNLDSVAKIRNLPFPCSPNHVNSLQGLFFGDSIDE